MTQKCVTVRSFYTQFCANLTVSSNPATKKSFNAFLGNHFPTVLHPFNQSTQSSSPVHANLIVWASATEQKNLDLFVGQSSNGSYDRCTEIDGQFLFGGISSLNLNPTYYFFWNGAGKSSPHNLGMGPILYSNLLYKMGHYFLDTQYINWVKTTYSIFCLHCSLY